VLTQSMPSSSRATVMLNEPSRNPGNPNGWVTTHKLFETDTSSDSRWVKGGNEDLKAVLSATALAGTEARLAPRCTSGRCTGARSICMVCGSTCWNRCDGTTAAMHWKPVAQVHVALVRIGLLEPSHLSKVL
jgi:hypothetical protein